MDNTQHEREQGIGTMSKSMLIVMIFTMVSKVTGFLRETVLASQFGAGAISSAYKTAQLIPCVFLSIIVTALSATLIPVYSTQLREGREKANRFVNNLFTVGMLLSLVILVLTAIFLEPIAGIYMREADDPETLQLVIQLAQMMMPMGIFVFLAKVTSAYLQANFNFTVPAISQLFLNVTVIAAILISRGADITYVALGTVLGWALQFIVQLPSARRTGLSYRPVFDLKESGLREVMFLMIPVLISSAFDQLYTTFDSMVAYRGDVGDPAKLDFANRISTMVSSVLLTTVATVLYPNLVRHVNDRDKFADNLSFGININLLIALPAMAALILLRVPITRLVYERNMFTAEDTRVTSVLLAAYSAGILGVGLRELCNRCFYAFKDTKVPTIVGIGAVALNIALNYALHPILGPAGIAAGTAISGTVSGLVLLFFLQRKRHVLEGSRVFKCLWKTLVATGAMSAVLMILFRALNMGTRGGMQLLMGMGIAFVAGVAVYAVMLLVLKTEELGMLVDMVKSKLKRA